ncbi:MAG: type II toxin-antitoxin system VapC family toxin, partial [Planctomycetaceae bacterium]|nr:type II toxin-antitoxin system VapC family toxin [Planctomycetaceae bacterium]
MQRPKVYLESATISYLTARPSENLANKFRQERTRLWWQYRGRYELFVSETVVNEIQRGDQEAARLRLEIIEGIPVLPHSDQVKLLARVFVSAGAMPPIAVVDAYHIITAAIHQMDYLVTWNQKHLVNPVKRRQIEELILGFQLKPPVIITPE